MATIGILTHELDKIPSSTLNAGSVTLLLLSCAIGVAISYLGWRARSLVTATCYTVLGVANKMLTVLANAMVWDQRASLSGMAFLCVCLIGAAGYKQAPLQEVPSAQAAAVAASKGGSKCRGRGVLYLCVTVIAGATVATLTKVSTPPTPPMGLVPPSAAPAAATPPLPAPSTGRGNKGQAGYMGTVGKPAHRHEVHAGHVHLDKVGASKMSGKHASIAAANRADTAKAEAAARVPRRGLQAAAGLRRKSLPVPKEPKEPNPSA